MNDNIEKETRLFEDYLRGNLSEKEEMILVDWIKLSEKNFLAFKKYIIENQFSLSCSEDTNQVWQKLKFRIEYHKYQEDRKTIIIPNWIKFVASILIALFFGYFANQYIQEYRNSFKLNEIIIPEGEEAQIVLSDGTKVYLNAGTSLIYPTSFYKKNRKVSITGEAFFKVTKDKTNPFIVETPNFNVKVTGTSFNLNTYPDDQENSLVLHTGEVTILNNERELKIHPGEKYIFNTQTKSSEVVKADLYKSTLWIKGVVVIDNLNLDEIRKILERKFDVQIKIVEERYKEIRYNGQFKSHESLEDALNLIKEASPIKFNYTIDKVNKIVIIK